MSDLRIRSEAVPDEVWPEAFVPMPSREADDGDLDESDFGPFVVGVSRALTGLFGMAVAAVPGRPPRPERDEVVPRVAAVLAAALTTVQMGGDLARVDASEAGQAGLALARQARAIALVLDGVADRLWPQGCRLAGFDLDVSCGAVTGHVHVPAPAGAVVRVPVVLPSAVMAARLFDLPMRVRVELASGMVAVARLLPLRAGTVLPIDPVLEMPLIMGDHRIGHATLTPMPDGRQQAVITDIRVEALGAGL